MSVAKVIEIIAGSKKSFEDAVNEGLSRATDSVSDFTGAWIKDQRVIVANGKVVEITLDNPYRGGRVTIETAIKYMDRGKEATLYLDALHITPLAGLRYGDVVKAGQLIGHTQPPDKAEIGSRSHVHFSAGPIARTWTLHTDPNQFWQKGPGVLTCFNPANPPTDLQVVAPVRCAPR